MIRRPTSVIVLPPRQDLVKAVEFSAEERREYLKIENSLQELPNDMVSYSAEVHISMSTIQLINKLRLFCNLGVCSITTIPVVGGQIVANRSERKTSAETLVTSKVALGGTDCVVCYQIIDAPDIPSTAGNSPYAYYSECCKLYCSSCAVLVNYQTTRGFSCCQKSRCVLHPLFPEMVQEARNDPLPPDICPTETSKIRALVQEILSCLPEKR